MSNVVNIPASNISIEDLARPVTFPVEAYISDDYARAEGDKLWAKVWQHAGRVEELPDIGSYITYDIGNDSILIVRTAADKIKAFHNVCTHRGPQTGRYAARRQSSLRHQSKVHL